ncbi:protein translocase SEC61 complex subunit gamma [Candidatus Woesearchaeota archaeon]|nr:protein translocase SEC61 complex subunit gamma [Candidatus Woesearchaeota archaeon]
MELLLRIKEFALESRRIFRITKKPTNEELKVIVKVSGLGILLIGAIGFLMQMVARMITK